MLGEGDRLARAPSVAVHDQHLGRPTGQGERRLDRLGQTLADAVAADQPVDHHLDGVEFVAGQVDLGPLGELDGDRRRPGPGRSLAWRSRPAGCCTRLCGPAPPGPAPGTSCPRGARAPGRRSAGGSGGPRAGRSWGSGVPDAGVEQPQVVVDLGDGADRRTRVAGGRLLVDGDGGRKALDEVHVGLVHLAQELAGVGREGFDIAALALGVDGVEGQGRFARAREAGEDDQLVPGQVEGDILRLCSRAPRTTRRSAICRGYREAVTHPGRRTARSAGPGRLGAGSARDGAAQLGDLVA